MLLTATDKDLLSKYGKPLDLFREVTEFFF